MPDGAADVFIENRTFDELAIGETASLSHTVTQRDIDLFATVTGDVNPAHVDPAYAETDMFHHVIIQGMWGAGLISATLGTRLPGPGTIYLGQDLRFRHPVSIGDTITATVTVHEKKPEKADVTLDCVCTNQNGEAVITGTAFTRAPTTKVRVKRVTLPYVRVGRHDGTRALLARAAGGAAVATAVVYPGRCRLVAARPGRGGGRADRPGPDRTSVTNPGGGESGRREHRRTPPDRCAGRPCRCGKGGRACSCRRGRPADERRSAHRRTDACSRCPRHRPAHGPADQSCLSDGRTGLSSPVAGHGWRHQHHADLGGQGCDRAERNRPGACHGHCATARGHPRRGGDRQRPDALHARCRGAVQDGRPRTDHRRLLDGPLAFDNAINEAAAAEKGIVSPVAGRADILVVPDLEAGNMLAKQLTFLAGAEAAGVVLGARVPIILSSRADSARTRLASCALGVLIARAGTAV
jgi:acyl dehydratase